MNVSRLPFIGGDENGLGHSVICTTHQATPTMAGTVVDDRTEEREGLLSGGENLEDYDHFKSTDLSQKPWPRNKIVGAVVAFLLILVGGVFARTLLVSPPTQWTAIHEGDGLVSNGTHDFKKTVVIVSIDGLRCVFFLSLVEFQGSLFSRQCRLSRPWLNTSSIGHQQARIAG
jgi:hypothetical protein